MNTLLQGSQLRGAWLRWLVWGGAAALLLTPLVLWLFSPRPLSPSPRVLGWALALMAPAMALFVVLSLQFPSADDLGSFGQTV